MSALVRRLFTIVPATVLVAGCVRYSGAPPVAPAASNPASAPAAASSNLAVETAAAHGGPAWATKTALRATLSIDFVGGQSLNGTLLYEMGDGRVRLELVPESTLVFDGERAWLSPPDAPVMGARFNLLTWPYFIAAPFKLGDPGTTLEPAGDRPYRDASYRTARLTFAPGVGDSPDDWYLLYVDPATSRLAAMAYIVTYYGTSDAPQAHGIEYDAFETIDGIVLATRWTFRPWSAEQGFFGPVLGEGRLEDIAFVTPPDGAFEKPPGAREDPRP